MDPLQQFRLDGRVVVVTGASSGFGDRFARVLHAAGASVVVAARRVERLEALAGELPGTLAVGCDVANDADLERLVATTLAQHGRIDVLVNNAGTAESRFPVEDEPIERFREVLAVNLTGAFRLCQLVAKPMIAAGRGSIVNVASVLGEVSSGQMKQASYAASKGGLITVTRELAAHWARKGVRVNALAPGFFATALTRDMVDDERGHAWLRNRTPMGRIGEEGELDGALLFLASDASSYVTGSVLTVDGGYTII